MPRKLVTFCVISLCLTDSSGLEDNKDADSIFLGKLQEVSQSQSLGIDYSRTKDVQKAYNKSNNDVESIEEVSKTSANNQIDSKAEEISKDDLKTLHPTDSPSRESYEVLDGLRDANIRYSRQEKLSEFLKAALQFKNERDKQDGVSNTFHRLEDDQNGHQNDVKSPDDLEKDDLNKNSIEYHTTTNKDENKVVFGSENAEKSREYGEYYEGDMIIEKDRVRNSVLHTSYWVNGVVPFDFDNNFPQEHRKKVLKVINYLNHLTCLHFRKHWFFLDGPHYVRITNSKPGCFATVGKPSKGTGKVNLGPSCMKKDGIIIHELLHSIGLFHEHSRHDRDQYVKIHWENIKPSDRHNFIMRNNLQVATIPYDYYSIMHYSTHAYTKNGLQTLEPTKPADVRMMGQRDFLTKWDLAKVKSLYCR